jgi:hypothetical protein
VVHGGRVPAAARAEAQVWLREGTLALDHATTVLAGTNRIAQTVITATGVNAFVLAEELFPALPPADEYPDVDRR